MAGEVERAALAEAKSRREQKNAVQLEAFRKSLERDPTQTVAMLARAFHMGEERVRVLRREMGFAPAGPGAVVSEADR